jgi:hypothetical protein
VVDDESVTGDRLDGGQPESVEWVDFGPGSESEVLGSGGWHWRWWYGAVALVLVAALIVLHGRQGSSPHATAPSSAPKSSPRPSSTPTPPVTSSAPAVPTPGSQPLVQNVGHPLLAVPSDWELFGEGTNGVVRVELAKGVVTSTTVPVVDGGGSLSFVVGPTSVVVRPYDEVPGYVVPDGQPATAIATTTDLGAAVLGPDPNHYWSTNSNDTQMSLVGFDGARTGSTITVPIGVQPISDGDGYLMFTGTSGVYDLRPSSTQRITTGFVLAAGPSGWLVSECDPSYKCSTYVVSRATGTRRSIAGPAASGFFAGNGIISPDGSMAALLESASSGSPTIHLIDLATGKDRDTGASVDISLGFGEGTYVWSPDGRWLFAAGTGQRLQAIDVRANHVSDLGIDAHVTQVALRTSSS